MKKSKKIKSFPFSTLIADTYDLKTPKGRKKHKIWLKFYNTCDKLRKQFNQELWKNINEN